jgi:phytoene synthase
MPPMAEHPAATDAGDEAVGRGVPAGSLRYFAVLFGAAEVRPQLEALYAFEAELRRIVDGSSHEAAHARLQWWRGEVDRLAVGRPSHPLSIALTTLRRPGGPDLALLHECLTAADLDLANHEYANWQQLEAYCFRSAGALQTLIAGLLAAPRELSADERQFARRLGSAVRQAEMLRDLALDLARGRIYLPGDELAGAGLDAAALHAADPRAIRLLSAWRNRVRSELVGLPACLGDARVRSTQRHGLVLAALHAQLLGRIDPTASAATVRASPGPLARLWTAWRTAVRNP